LARTSGDFVHDYYRRSEAGETRHTPVFVSVLERADRSLGRTVRRTFAFGACTGVLMI
jgi:hypothetical protein